MKYNCDLISDLLPLYKDEICSEASRKIIEEHLAECPDCKKMLSSLNDVTIDEKIVKEKEEVIGTQAKFFKRKSALAGSIIGLIFSIPILVCLIVNLATGAGLTWFFIVLAGILVAASVIIVPLMLRENRMFMTMASFTASVMLLLGVVCIYSGGNWFFVTASATLFGLTHDARNRLLCRNEGILPDGICSLHASGRNSLGDVCDHQISALQRLR